MKKNCKHAYVQVNNLQSNKCIYCGKKQKLTLARMVAR